jgi:aquaporin rerated protein, other eukaryote
VLFYKFIKILEYEMANPGQDETTEHDAALAAAGTPKKETV